MPDIQNITFSHKEIAEILIKKSEIHEGFWGIFVEFGLGAGNINHGPGGDELLPAAIIPVIKIGIQRFASPNNLTVNAADVNPG